MKKLNLILFILLCHSYSAQGLILDKESYENTDVWENEEAFGFSTDVLPTKISYRKYNPAIMDQGPLSTCVGWSIGYAQLTTQQNIKMGETRYQQRSVRAMDPAFIFGLIRDGDDQWCQNGAKMEAAMYVLTNYGNKPMNFEPLMRCNETSKYDEFCMKVASMYQIDGYFKLPKANLNDKIKEALYYGFTVSIGVNLTESFKSGASIYKGNWRPSYNEETIDGHAMLIVGYDDNRNGGSFEVMNSWGADFGDNGYVWIRYSDMEKRCEEAYVIDVGDSFDTERCSYGDCANSYSRYKYNSDMYDVYEGQFKNKRPHVYGSMIYKNGDIYIGDWTNGRKDGYGITYIKAVPQWYFQRYSNDNVIASDPMGFGDDQEKVDFLKAKCKSLQGIFPGDLIEDPESDEALEFEEVYEVPENPVTIGE
jgi:hypothetical protein